MNNILDEKPSFVESVSWGDENTNNDLDDILKDYKDGYIEASKPLEVSQSDTSINVIPEAETEKPLSNDTNDKRYFYQSGKKAGQRKPERLVKKALQENGNALPPNGTTLSGAFITGALALTFINLLLPLIICGLNNAFSKVKVDEALIKLSKEQKRELEPLYDAALKQLEFKGNPVTLAIVATLGIMLMNFVMIRNMESDKIKNKTEPVKL